MKNNEEKVLADISVRNPELLESITLDNEFSNGDYIWEYNKLALNLQNRTAYESWETIFNDFNAISGYREKLGLIKDSEDETYNLNAFVDKKQRYSMDKNLFIANSYLIMKMYNEEFEGMKNFKNDKKITPGYSPLAQRRDEVTFLSTPVDPKQAMYLDRILN